MRLPLLSALCGSGLAAALMLATVAINAAEEDVPLPQAGVTPDLGVRERIRAYEDGSARRLIGILRLERADGQAFYVIEAPCCDLVNPLYDAEGRRICAPNGGFAGSGDGRCPAWVYEMRPSLPRHLQATGRPTPPNAAEPPWPPR